MTLIKFTRNYRDLSTEQGFQFEFYCDRCGSGHQTQFQASATGTVANVLDTASGLLGGLLGNVADVSRQVHSATWEKAHDKAFAEAIEQIKPYFRQCKRCSKWVDDECWNSQRGLCKDCTPDLEAEFSAAQTEAAVFQAREKAREVEQVSAEKFKKVVVGACPHCGANITGGKFCPECGQALAQEKHCTECGAKMPASAKFCPDCGTKQ